MASSSSLAAAKESKGRMDRFLNSFDDNITIDSGDATHKSVDHKQGSTEQKKTLTRFSTLTREDLDEQSAKDFDTFQRQGFVIMEDVLSAEEVEALQKDTSSILAGASFGDNKFYGRKTKRAYALLAKTLTVVPLLASPRINTLIDALFAPNALLSALQLVEIHPGEVEQTLHYDQQFQNIHPSRDPFSNDPFVVNCILAIDDFTPEKGGTTLLPGSHLWPVGRLPTPDDPRINLTMKAGSVCCFSGLLWHAGGANITSEARKGLITSFTQPWFRPLENLFLAVPFKVAIDLPPIVQTRMGYSLHHPFTGQVDFKHPIHKLKELASL